MSHSIHNVYDFKSMTQILTTEVTETVYCFRYCLNVSNRCLCPICAFTTLSLVCCLSLSLLKVSCFCNNI